MVVPWYFFTRVRQGHILSRISSNIYLTAYTNDRTIEQAILVSISFCTYPQNRFVKPLPSHQKILRFAKAIFGTVYYKLLVVLQNGSGDRCRNIQKLTFAWVISCHLCVTILVNFKQYLRKNMPLSYANWRIQILDAHCLKVIIMTVFSTFLFFIPFTENCDSTVLFLCGLSIKRIFKQMFFSAY